MSALNYFCQGPTAFLLQDAATYAEDGTITRLRTKGEEIPEWRAFIASDGQAGASELFSRFLPSQFNSIDDFAECGESVLASVAAHVFADFERFGLPGFRCLVVGWSDRLCRMRGVEFRMPRGEARFVFDPDKIFAVTGWDESGIDESAFLDFIFAKGFRNLDPIRDVLPIVTTKQRFMRTPPTELIPNAYVVGGHITLTVVGIDGPRTVIVHRWPLDRVGEKIDPFKAAHLVEASHPFLPLPMAIAAHGNRRERRAAAARGRCAA